MGKGAINIKPVENRKVSKEVDVNVYRKKLGRRTKSSRGIHYSDYVNLQRLISNRNSGLFKFVSQYASSKKFEITPMSVIGDSVRALVDLNFTKHLSLRDMISINEDLLSSLVSTLDKDKEIRSYLYMKNDNIMTSISVKQGSKVHFVNFTDKPLDCAFGLQSSPVGLNALIDFLGERCVPKSRFNIDEVLKNMGLSEYNEVDIIEKTYGILIDDSFWVKDSSDAISYKEALEKVGLEDLKNY
jgi:hypothetical protein